MKRHQNFHARIVWLVLFFVLFTLHSSLFTAAFASEKWQGVDESVVEKVAKEHGREAKTPLINTDQGDLLLFVFLLAGVAGGFTAGYYWRVMMDTRRDGNEAVLSASPRNGSEKGPTGTTGRTG
jgi:hypothetical protein